MKDGKKMSEVHEISNWWVGALATLPVVGVYFALKKDNREEREADEKKRHAIYKKIDECNARIAEAHAKIAESELKLSQCRLDVEGRFASNGYLHEVETRMSHQIKATEQRVSARMDSMETNLIAALKKE